MGQFERKLLLVSGQEAPEAGLVRYAAEIGGRTGCAVLVLGSGLASSGHGAPAAIDYIAREGDLAAAVETVCRHTRRIEFILTDAPEIRQVSTGVTMIPVFGVTANTTNQPGGGSMSLKTIVVSKRPIGKTILFGCLSAVLYAAYFWNTGWLTPIFSRGGAYAALPISTAFLVSFAHGAFAGNFWSLLGINAKTKIEVHKTVSAEDRPAQTKPKRPRAYAYVNPFHNILLKK